MKRYPFESQEPSMPTVTTVLDPDAPAPPQRSSRREMMDAVRADLPRPEPLGPLSPLEPLQAASPTAVEPLTPAATPPAALEPLVPYAASEPSSLSSLPSRPASPVVADPQRAQAERQAPPETLTELKRDQPSEAPDVDVSALMARISQRPEKSLLSLSGSVTLLSEEY